MCPKASKTPKTCKRLGWHLNNLALVGVPSKSDVVVTPHVLSQCKNASLAHFAAMDAQKAMPLACSSKAHIIVTWRVRSSTRSADRWCCTNAHRFVLWQLGILVRGAFVFSGYGCCHATGWHRAARG